MVDKEYKLDFMVKILESVTGESEFNFGYCLFNYFGLSYEAGFDDFLKTMDSDKIKSVSKALNQIVDDKVNYKKYLNANTEQYLLNVYNEEYCSLAVKYKVTYMSKSFPKFFPKDIKSFVRKHNTFYILGDCLDSSIADALVAIEDLSRYVFIMPDEVKSLLANATEWSFANIGQLPKQVNESPDFIEL